MNVAEHELLQSERNELQRLLAMTPKSSVIDRASIKSRLSNVEERLSAGEPDRPRPSG